MWSLKIWRNKKCEKGCVKGQVWSGIVNKHLKSHILM